MIRKFNEGLIVLGISGAISPLERQNRTLPNKFRFSELAIHLPIPVHHYRVGFEYRLRDRGTVLREMGWGLERQVGNGFRVVEVEVYRGMRISELQNYFESPIEENPEPGRRAGLH